MMVVTSSRLAAVRYYHEIKRYLEERSAYLFEKDAEAMFLVTIGRYKGARLGVRSIERIVSTIRKRQL